MPGTPAEIDKAYVDSFNRGFAQAFQQMDSVMLPYVNVEPMDSEFDYFDRIGAADDMTEDTTRYGDNPVSEIEHDRRRLELRDFELGKYVDPKDLHRVATDPTNAYTQAMVASGGRKIDDLVFDGAYGTTRTGKRGATTVSFVSDGSTSFSAKVKVGEVSKGHSNPITTAGNYVLESGNYEGIVVSHNWDYSTGTAADINTAKLRIAKFTMMRLDALKPGEKLDVFMTAQQFDRILDDDKLINLDYATRARFENLETTEWGGFRFHHYENTPVDSDGYRRVLVTKGTDWLKLGMAKNLETNMWRDTAKKLIPYIYFKLSANATRFWGEVTAEIKCDETA